MDITTADAFNALRGYSDWTGSPTLKAAALVRAQDYIDATYRLRLDLTADEQRTVDSAICLLARDLLNSPLAIRATAAVAKESKEGAGFKKAVEYADAPADPYPFITILLAPLLVATGPASFAIGKLVR